MQASDNTLQFKTIDYIQEKNEITILDQTKLPEEETYVTLGNVEAVYNAITTMQVRGAPLIGVTAAYGVVLAATTNDIGEVNKAADHLQSARPTAVNLSWALKRMKKRAAQSTDLFHDMLEEAQRIEKEDIVACEKMAGYGSTLVKNNAQIMVHCNAGALATSGIGTALGVLYIAKKQGKNFVVYSGETRPLLQGARLTSWELTKNGIETYTICDNMAATYMPDMDLVLVGADRIAGNGDTANKIGTRGLAIIARYFSVPFYVVAPISTFDFGIISGDEIPIEIRCEDEIRQFNTRNIVAKHAKVCNPAFDVTPADLIAGIVTEKGILHKPFKKAIERLARNDQHGKDT